MIHIVFLTCFPFRQNLLFNIPTLCFIHEYHPKLVSSLKRHIKLHEKLRVSKVFLQLDILTGIFNNQVKLYQTLEQKSFPKIFNE